MVRKRRILAVVVFALLAACASSPGGETIEIVKNGYSFLLIEHNDKMPLILVKDEVLQVPEAPMITG